eukprot:scaffold2090_cov225-Prasinococcus_capsulatus_cf.AAC.32
MAGLVDKYVSLLNTSLVAFVDEFACRVYEELDYTKEGENAVSASCTSLLLLGSLAHSVASVAKARWLSAGVDGCRGAGEVQGALR